MRTISQSERYPHVHLERSSAASRRQLSSAMRDALLWLLVVGPPIIVYLVGRARVEAQEAETQRVSGRYDAAVKERDSLKDQVRELEQSLEAVARERDALKAEIVYLGWDVETAQQLHKIAEFKLRQHSVE